MVFISRKALYAIILCGCMALIIITRYSQPKHSIYGDVNQLHKNDLLQERRLDDHNPKQYSLERASQEIKPAHGSIADPVVLQVDEDAWGKDISQTRATQQSTQQEDGSSAEEKARYQHVINGNRTSMQVNEGTFQNANTSSRHDSFKDGRDENKSRLNTADRLAASTTCLPKYRASFIKIHKTGSGSIHNVLLGIALRYNLTVAIPYCPSEALNGYQMFPQIALQQHILNMSPLKDYTNYNLFFDHAVYDRNSQLRYMSPDTVFFTQIRHPFTQAESVFRHFGGPHRYDLSDEVSPLTTLLKSQMREMYFRTGRCFKSNQSAPVTRNFQAFTLGYMNADKNNVTEFRTFLKKLDSELFFVSLLEYLDESSILLKRKMCWHIRDVLHFQTHKTKQKNTVVSNVDEIKRQGELLHREWSKLDYILYDFFRERLQHELRQQPDDFYVEVEHYKSLNGQFSELCDRMCDDFAGIDATDIDTLRRLLLKGIDIPATQFNSAFRLTYFDCLIMVSKELVDKTVLKVHQYPDACTDLKKVNDYGLSERDCDFKQHVYPGYHVNNFKNKVLNTQACRSNLY